MIINYSKIDSIIPYLSIIIPTYNEGDNIQLLLAHIAKHIDSSSEIIIVDGGSNDDTIEKITSNDVKVIHSPIKQRAAQMNMGAQVAKNEILYFLHADVIPPITFTMDIFHAITEGTRSGWFSYQFDKSSPLLDFNASFTKRDGLFAGGGDQSLFITKDTFNDLGGFDESYDIMEDFAFTRKIKKENIPYTIITNDCIVSTRKYNNNSWLRVNFANLVAFTMFLTKWKSSKVKKVYHTILKP